MTVAVSSSASVLGVYNVSAQVALVIDAKANLLLIYNYEERWGVIINIETEVVVAVDHRNDNTKISFYNIFAGNVTLKGAFDQGEKITKEKTSVFIQASLVLLTNGEYTVSASEVWGLIIHIARTVSVSLRAVLVVIRTGYFTAVISLPRLIEIINRFAHVAINSEGGVNLILEHNVTISLEVLLSFKSTFEIAGYIWEQLIGADLEHIFDGLNTDVSVLQLLAGLSDNSTININGYITFLSKLVLYIEGKISLSVFVEVFVEFIAKNKGNVNLGAEFRAAVDSLYKLIMRLRLEERLKFVYDLLVKIREGKWVVAGVNINAIIKEIDEGLHGNALQLIIAVYKLLKLKLSIELGIIVLILHLIELLTVSGGVVIVAVIVEISISTEIAKAGAGALGLILRGVRILGLFGVGLYQTLAHLPVISQIFIQITIQLKRAEYQITIEGLFKSSACGEVVKIIGEVVKDPSHAHPGEGSTTTEKIEGPTSTAKIEVTATETIEEPTSTGKGEGGGHHIPHPPKHPLPHPVPGLGHGPAVPYHRIHNAQAKRHEAQGKHHTHEKKNKA